MARYGAIIPSIATSRHYSVVVIRIGVSQIELRSPCSDDRPVSRLLCLGYRSRHIPRHNSTNSPRTARHADYFDAATLPPDDRDHIHHINTTQRSPSNSTLVYAPIHNTTSCRIYDILVTHQPSCSTTRLSHRHARLQARRSAFAPRPNFSTVSSLINQDTNLRCRHYSSNLSHPSLNSIPHAVSILVDAAPTRIFQ